MAVMPRACHLAAGMPAREAHAPLRSQHARPRRTEATAAADPALSLDPPKEPCGASAPPLCLPRARCLHHQRALPEQIRPRDHRIHTRRWRICDLHSPGSDPRHHGHHLHGNTSWRYKKGARGTPPLPSLPSHARLAARSGSGEVEVGVEGAWLRGRRSSARDAEGGDAGDPVRCLL
jgi:hypothetical protein